MSRKLSFRIADRLPPPSKIKDEGTKEWANEVIHWMGGFVRTFNAFIQADKEAEDGSTIILLDPITNLPSSAYYLLNAYQGGDGLFHKANISTSSWALRFDLTTDLFEVLYNGANNDPITWTTLWSTTTSGIFAISGNIRWRSGTSFFGELDHNNTANRVYTYPDRNGAVAMTDGNETITGTWTFDQIVTSLQNLRWASGTSTFYGTLDHANTVDRTYLFPDKGGTVAMTDDGATFVDSASVDFTVTPGTPPSVTAVVLPAGVDHNSLNNIAVGDPHPQYLADAGRAGGQSAIGGTASGDDLFLGSTSHGTKGTTTVGYSGDILAFFEQTGATRQTVADLGALATTETAGAIYGANEQTMLGNLKTDVTSLRTKLNALLDALQAYGAIAG